MMPNAFAELRKFDDLCRKLGSEIDLTDETVIDALMEGETELKEIAAALVDDLDELDILRVGLIAKMNELKERWSSSDSQAERARSLLFKIMERWPQNAKGRRSMKLPTATLSYKAGAPKVIITDESALPFDMMRSTTKTEPDKSAIMDALKNGETVPGATLSNGPPSLQIRR